MPLPAFKPMKASVALLIAAVLAVFWLITGIHIVPHSHNIDFLNLYTGAWFAHHWDWVHVYHANAQIAQEKVFVPGHQGLWPFVRPPVYGILMSPLALIPFGPAFGWWLAVQVGVFLGCLTWAWRRFGPWTAVLGTLFFATPMGIALGQDCALYLGIVCVAFMLGERQRYFLCGLLLGLGLTKFHLYLLWPFVLLFERRWRMLLGFTVSGVIQGLVSLAVLGWAGLTGLADESGYLGFILHLNTYYAPKMNIDINSILLNTGLFSRPLLIGLTALLVGLILWSCRSTNSLGVTFALAISGSLLIAPHTYSYDGAMLLVPMWAIVAQPGFRWAKIGAFAVCSPLSVFAGFLGPPVEFFLAILLLFFAVAVSVENRLGVAKELVLAPAVGD
jgi:Glycosyltransferase family 87